MHSKRATWQWRVARVTVAIILLVGINAAAYLSWNRFFPNIPLFPESTSVSEELNEGPVPVAENIVLAQRPENAEDLIESLLAVASMPGATWRQVSNDPDNLLSIADTSCPAEPELFPSMQGQKTWGTVKNKSSNTGPESSSSPFPSTPPTTDDGTIYAGQQIDLGEFSYKQAQAGVVQQVSIFPAGAGAVAFDDLKNRISNCYYGEEWSLSYWTPLLLGQDSLYAVFSSSEGTQSLVAFRFGDVIGTVSERNYGMGQALASQWALRWPSLLQGLCKDTGSTVADASRQPLLVDLYQPYAAKRPIRLSETQQFEIQQEEDALARQRALSSASANEPSTPSRVYNLPDSYMTPAAQPMLSPGAEVTLNDAPASSYGLSVVIPDEPLTPSMPVFPEMVREVRNVEGPVLDKFGPGCGWALLSQEPPQFDEQASTKEWEKATAVVQEELAKDYRRWVRETWDYAIDYKRYLRDAQIWNSWATLAALRVAEVDWRHYDTLLAQYEIDVQAYQDILAAVLECEAELADAIREREEATVPEPNEDATESPSPSPTPPLPPLPECDERPTKPSPPSPPTADRPPNMLS